MRFLMPIVIALGLITGALVAAFAPLHAEIENGMSLRAAQDSTAIEDGTALQGTNLTYYPQPDFARCQADCANNGNCQGVTWIRAGTYNPGDPAMCYLMATVTGRSPARGHVSVVSASSGATGGMEEGTALQGTNLTYYAQPDFDRCQADCASNGQCKGFTWIKAGTYNPGDPAMCYLMATVTGRSPASGHVSMVGGGSGGGSASGGSRARLPGTTTAGPLGGRGRISVVGGTETPGWGVWASASGGRWDDPCAIQYNAARIAGNRYDGNPGYRRVRTRDTQQEADLDIDHFGRYHRDQPDGVAKMTSCASAGSAAPANIAGTWRGYRGFSYSISQSDNKFSWSQGDMQETGRGTINGNTISASWSGNNGSNSATGRIITSGNGYAIRIEWSNGVVFTR